MKKHHETSSKSRQKMMRCKRCHGIVAAMYVKLHVCSKQYKCDFCEMSYFAEKAYINHVAKHVGSRIPSIAEKHKCTICDKQFTSEKELVDHLSIHDDSNALLNCNICGKDFTSEEALVNHLQSHDKLDFKNPLKSKTNKLQERNGQLSSFERKVVMLKSEKKPMLAGPNKHSQGKHVSILHLKNLIFLA